MRAVTSRLFPYHGSFPGPRADHRQQVRVLAAVYLLAGILALAFGASVSARDATRADLSAKGAARVAAVTAPATDFTKPERFEAMSAGAATSRKQPDRNAFSQPIANLSESERIDFRLGEALFEKLWVSSPASTKASDGLGPLFNARSCAACHIRDGRGHPPKGPDDDAVSMFLRLSVPPQSDADRARITKKAVQRIPEPTYGGQLQDQAVGGLSAEGRMVVSYTEHTVTLSGGETATLRKPTYTVDQLAYGPMHPDVRLSARVAPPMIGLGLLEQIHPDSIAAHADPDDSNGDGISGRLSTSRDPETGQLVVGRYGWKASLPTIPVQTAKAFAGDIGISNPLATNAWGDCTERQADCRAMRTGVQPNLGDTEAPDPVLALTAFYSRNLAVPARRDVDDPGVLAGKRVFYEIGCASCHRPKFVTRRDAPQRAHRFQLIWPYTDLLLHDMGEGLADNRPVGDASGREWRTAPLWGIGLTETVSGHSYFLHDGRARNLLEAILWHGGEAQAARDAVVAMESEDRAALLRFLESL